MSRLREAERRIRALENAPRLREMLEARRKDRRLMELLATGALRLAGRAVPDLAALSEAELLRIIGADSRALYDKALEEFVAGVRAGRYPRLVERVQRFKAGQTDEPTIQT